MQTGTRAPRRRHSQELKARVLQACVQPGASVAAVAQAHGLERQPRAQVASRAGSANAHPSRPGSRCRASPRRVHPTGAAFDLCRRRRAAPCCAGGRHPHRMAPRCSGHRRQLARECRPGVRPLVAAMHGGEMIRTPWIRIDALWLATQPIDMRCGADTLLARVVHVFGSAQAHHGHTDDASSRAPAPAQTASTARAPGARRAPPRAREHHLPNGRLRPADAARGRGRERAAGHRAGAVLRAPPHSRQVGLAGAASCWCRSRSSRRSSIAACPLPAWWRTRW